MQLSSGIQNTDLAAFDLTGGRAPLGLSLPGPGSLLAHLPVPALPPLGVCPGGGGKGGRGPLPDPLFIENCRQLHVCMHDA